MALAEKIRRKLARWIAPSSKIQHRMYAGARSSRLTAGWNEANSSADAELSSSLTKLRARSRSLVRDSSYAKRARTLVVSNVIGSGIGLQAQVKTTRDELNRRVNEDIENAWREWSRGENCHTGGRLSFPLLERAIMAQIFEAGEVFVREHYRPFGNSRIPYALELIEAERIADEYTSPAFVAPGNEIRQGIEVDRFYRPVAYYIRERHPSELRWMGATDRVERVPASEIIHLADLSRWPQTRGEPWMHAAARRLNDMDGYSEAEITRARVQAASVGAIETPEDATSFGEEQSDGTVEMEVEPGVYKRLAPGERLNALSPTSPNPALDPFMRYMLREVASGIGVSYASLSSDYSQSNYSSSRLALLDDRDLWKFLQSWIVCELRERVHRHWLQQAVISGALRTVTPEQYMLEPARYERARFKVRGWSWIDPTSEVEAYKEAVKAGFTTVSKVIANTGGGDDLEDVIEERKHELEAMAEAGLKFDTSPEAYIEPPAADPPDNAATDPTDTEEDPPARVFSFPRTGK